MGAMKLYRLLREHVNVMNALVVALYKEQITQEDALAKATEAIEQILKEINGQE